MKLFQFSFRFNKSLIFLFAITVINLGLIFLPLTNSLGYEFSSVNSIVLFLIGGFFLISKFKSAKEQQSDFLKLVSADKKILIAFAFIPLAIGALSTILFSKCPLEDGFYFYIAVTLPAYISGLVFAYLAVFINKRFSVLIFLFFFLILALSSIIEIYRYPEISFFNLLIGYFPGTIYDEDLSVNNLLIAYRLMNIAFLIIIIFAVDGYYKRMFKNKPLIILLLTFLAVGFYFAKPMLHFATDKTRLENSLRNKIVSSHFDIFYPDSVFTDKEAEFAGLVHEYYLEQDEAALNIRYKDMIDSYIFENREQKRNLIGAGNANLAKPWLNQIYLNKTSFVVTLKHELVHVLASRFGVTPFKIADGFNSALLEGFAMAVENNYDGYPVHYLARLAYKAGYRIPIEKLFSGMNFFLQASAMSYVYAGSFIKFLSDGYGIDKVEKLYGDMNFKKLFGKNLIELAADYESFISNYKIDFNKYQAQLYFSGQTIFKKYCPRVAASENKKAGRLFNKGNFKAALDIYKSVYGYSNTFDALVGIVNSLSKLNKYEEAEKFLRDEIVKFKKGQYYFYLELLEGDLLVEINKPNDAGTVYDSLFAQNPHIDYRNGVLIRKAFLSRGVDSLTAYLHSSEVGRQAMLLMLNEKEIKYYTIPYMVSLRSKDGNKLEKFFISIENKVLPNDFETYYSMMAISKYFLINGDYNNAQIFAVKSLQANLDNDNKHRFVENLRMVNWFKNFAAETKIVINHEK